MYVLCNFSTFSEKVVEQENKKQKSGLITHHTTSVVKYSLESETRICQYIIIDILNDKSLHLKDGCEQSLLTFV